MFAKFVVTFSLALFFLCDAYSADGIGDTKGPLQAHNNAISVTNKSIDHHSLPEEKSFISPDDNPEPELIDIEAIKAKKTDAALKKKLETGTKDVHIIPKMLSKDALLEKIKQAIKPVLIHEKADNDIAIKYEFPSMQIEKSQTTAAIGKNVTMSVSNKSTNSSGFTEYLSKGYKAAMQGQLEVSLMLYNNALKAQPDSLNAMYAMAAIYHKLMQYSDAKRMYEMILGIDPHYQNALNNYLVVMAEESPEQALIEFRKLETVNPNFSPIQAQIGMVYAKIKDYNLAVQYLIRAVMLSPEISNYRYNLAVLYDKMGHHHEALISYRQLLAYEKPNEPLPVNSDYLRSRINYLTAEEGKNRRAS